MQAIIMVKSALVTGGNRGIGFETCRQLAQASFKVILTSRNKEKGEEAVKKLVAEKLDVYYLQLDVTDLDSIKRAREIIEENFGALDVLVNNAGVFLDKSKDISNLKDGILEATFEVNFFGAFYMMREFIPLMKKNGYGRIINVSSQYGDFENALNPIEGAYKLSKHSLNALTRMMASAVDGQKIKINSMCPGWVRTKMGGLFATKKVEDAPDTIIWLATLDDNGPTGKFFSDRQEVEW